MHMCVCVCVWEQNKAAILLFPVRAKFSERRLCKGMRELSVMGKWTWIISEWIMGKYFEMGEG